jgi:hypothetical protein
MFRLLTKLRAAKAEKARHAAALAHWDAKARKLTQVQHGTRAALREANHAALRASVAR